MAAKLTRLIHKIAIQLHLVAESCNVCSFRSRLHPRKHRWCEQESYLPENKPPIAMSSKFTKILALSNIHLRSKWFFPSRGTFCGCECNLFLV